RGFVLTRDASLRVCSYCAAPRSPERIVYQEEVGDTFLVRFGLPDAEGTVHALAWVDAPWRLLGATALLLHPTLPYVVARYRRKGVDERILTSRSSLARLAAWLPGAEIEVLEEGPGARWAGRPYDYPLRSEFPMGADLVAPAGTIQTVPDVGDSGTGIVPLVPGHGGTDAQIAERLGISGWPLVTARGQLATTLMHKYAGLDLATASEFVLRDLGDGGAMFARLRVRRGVPHCAICGTALVWAPGRAWCLEPTRLPPEWAAAYRRLLPTNRPSPSSRSPPGRSPSRRSTPPGPGVVTLLESPRLRAVG
ncbi:isoleucyl-tRNA synthetase, partial [mine drainage metagenome]